MGQDLLFQFCDKMFVIRGVSISFGIPVASRLLPVAERSHRLLIVRANRSKLRVANEATPDIKFTAREAGHDRAEVLHGLNPFLTMPSIGLTASASRYEHVRTSRCMSWRDTAQQVKLPRVLVSRANALREASQQRVARGGTHADFALALFSRHLQRPQTNRPPERRSIICRDATTPAL